MKITKNPDKDEYEEAYKVVNANGGYCPCSLEKIPDTLCPCKKFLESIDLGKCDCGKYVKLEL